MRARPNSCASGWAQCFFLRVAADVNSRGATMTEGTAPGRMPSTLPWRVVAVFVAVSTGTTTAIALLATSRGWTVQSPAWGLLAPIAMWAPALARFIARRTVDREFDQPLTLSRWGTTGARVVLMPLAVPLVVYGLAYLIAWLTGLAQWNPGTGRWTTGSQIVLNVVINLGLLSVIGTATALGEEIGWRGYLQPRLD